LTTDLLSVFEGDLNMPENTVFDDTSYDMPLADTFIPDNASSSEVLHILATDGLLDWVEADG
jgi:hypothetical protein